MQLRKFCVLSVSLLWTLALFSGGAEAALRCEAHTTPANVTAGAASQTLGDIVLFCSDPTGPAAPAIDTRQVRVTLIGHPDLFSSLGNVQTLPVANAVVLGSIRDAVLTVNTNTCGSPATAGGAYGTCGAPDSRFQDPQYAAVANPQTGELIWSDIDFPNPGADQDNGGPLAPHPNVTVIRISNLKADLTNFAGGRVIARLAGGLPMNFTFPVVGLTGPTSGSPGAAPGPGTTGQSRCRFINGLAPLDRNATALAAGKVRFECENTPPPGGVTSNSMTADVYAILNVNYTGTVNNGNTQAKLIVNGNQGGAITGVLLSGSRTIRFPAVTIPVPGAGGNPAKTLVEIEGIVANATQVTKGKVLAAVRFGGFPSLPLNRHFTEIAAPSDKIGIYTNGSWLIDYDGDRVFEGCGIDKCGGFGLGTDQPFPGDYDGDGFYQIGLFRVGATYNSFFLDNQNYTWNGCFGGELCMGLGQPGDLAIRGDFIGLGKDQIGLFRNGSWFIDNGNLAWDGCFSVDPDICAGFGQAGDTAVIGDFDGDGITQIGLFRNGSWFLDTGNRAWDGCATELCMGLGKAGDIPVVGDFNGDGKDQIGVFRAGSWFIDNGNFVWDGCGVDICAGFGSAGSKPVVGDYNGDGIDDIATFEAGFWAIDNGNFTWDGCGVETCVTHGASGDKPVPGPY